MPYPLNEFFETLESKKQGGHYAIGDDYYTIFSRMPLSEHINRSFNFLKSTYIAGNNHTESLDENINKERETFFSKSYDRFYNTLSQGQNPLSCEEDIIQTLCSAFQSKELQACFSRSMVWALCADILFRNDYIDNTWSTLLSYKKSECFTELAVQEEYKLSVSNTRRKAGKRSYAYRKPMQNNFIKLLASNAPGNGWSVHKEAAHKLTPIVFKLYDESEHSAVIKFNEEEIERILLGWLKTNKACREAFNENCKKQPF